MEKLFIPVNKIRIALYVLFFIFLLGTAIFFQFIDRQQNSIWNLLTYICIALLCYLIYIYGKDLLSKKSGLCIEEKGLYLNLEYYKDIRISWEDITDIQNKKFTFFVYVKDPEKYLDQIPKILGILIKGNIKRFGTLFVIRYGQIDMKKEILFDTLKKAINKSI